MRNDLDHLGSQTVNIKNDINKYQIFRSVPIKKFVTHDLQVNRGQAGRRKFPVIRSVKVQSCATRFSEFVVTLPHPFSMVTIASQLYSDHLNSAQFLQFI